MTFDAESIHACKVSTGCAGDDGSIPTDPRCSDVTFCMANPTICGTECGSREPCSDPDYRSTHLTECGDDPRCVDPVFAVANPGLCLEVPTLILKPEYVTREVGASVQYTAVLLIGGLETVLSSGVIFASADTSVAVVASSAGNATGLSAGITTISAQYGTLYAFAQLEIVLAGVCDARSNAFALVIDHSKSTSGAFSGMYANRLAFAKAQAILFAESMNLDKDSCGVMSFDGDTAQVLGFVAQETDTYLIKSAVNSIGLNNLGRTNIGNALLEAKAFVDENSTGGNTKKIIALFSDGENNEGADPVAIATQLKSEGYIIFVLGLRAKATAFLMLDRISTGGFFINALPSNESSVAGWMAGLKGYICSGNCEPAGGAVIGQGSLNYTNFINWDVTRSHVDLIGKNTNGPELFDLLPGNGLYVDLCGSTDDGAGTPDAGQLTNKGDGINWENGKTYEVTITLAGNQRLDASGFVTSVEVTDLNADDLAYDTFEPTTFDEGFTEYTMSFTVGPTQAGIGGRVIISQYTVASGGNVYGNLLGSVRIYNVTDDVVLLEDDFDDENASFIDPPCTDFPDISSYGYDCPATGCLESPIEVQIPDPAPYSWIES